MMKDKPITQNIPNARMQRTTGNLTYLSETEDVINEQEHALPFSILEMLSNCQISEANANTSTRRLIHLSVHQSTLALTLRRELSKL
jgi:hypothetical protein